ncbi:MAG TPA: ammonium transporter [Sulfurovum sp.]|jgi:Amt family ammonium transporter|nr:MAG: ammonium transporter [Sulfurovum sp. 35-42-20]OYY57317.1 MAG: ammonium transporter [Sulfurovum sp. 28-43-6]OYZ25722.1 MAG: ammonium transporter [Sulfurovum sp. 16-42-52]OYZ50290.1 MAG: ammonium transporter [Sulfurovum sp. 24-42-9]OZA45115.1 MAG: ammonium transporter [Sulfurovum sp. 17-42-90]OZA60353.1 MAG: ammonium transporter [Sulfurovum sp. 39-42-12]HQR73341.1 ammonium transporter [Sulfurovum sp.]
MDIHYIIDTLFALFSMTLIIFMVPGFAMLEAGLVRTKNVTAVLTTNMMVYAVASMGFLLLGYQLAFGGWENDAMSQWAAFLFQMAFVGKTVNIMSGGVSERTRIIPLTFFTVVMATLIYPLVVNVTWGANLLEGSLLDIASMHDLAGCTVIHSTGGWALLAAIMIIGPRRGRYTKEGKIHVIPASNIPLVVLGALLLWIGWFGFNGGSIGSISSKENADLVALTILNTNTAGLAGAIMVAVLLYVKYKRFDITMILNGALGGLVSITAGADLFDIYSPILIGGIGGIIVVLGVSLFDKFRLDDPVGALSVHLLNGIWGTLAVALFADVSFWGQVKGILVVGMFAFCSSFVVLYLLNKMIPFRAEDDVELEGLDVNECGLEAYPEFKRSI